MTTQTELVRNAGTTSGGGVRAGALCVALMGGLMTQNSSSQASAATWEGCRLAPSYSTSNSDAGGCLKVSEGVPIASMDPVMDGTRRTVSEIRRLSGLTWDQMARLFGVSRRTAHFWAIGKSLTAANEERIGRLLGTLLRIDRGSASKNRAALMAPGADGVIPFDLLIDGRLADAESVLGTGRGFPRAPAMPLSRRARMSRRPPSPIDLLGGDDLPVPVEHGPVLPAKRAKRVP